MTKNSFVAEVTFNVCLGSNSKEMTDKEKKRGRLRYKYLNILRMKRT